MDVASQTVHADGRQIGQMELPQKVRSAAMDFALGGNPHYTGSSEHLACRVARLKMFVHALSPQQVTAECENSAP